jgi:hypothetical protein
MNERIQIAFKIISSHFVLPIGLIVTSALVAADNFMFCLIAQTVLVILFLTGYWEFFNYKFRNLFFIFLELALLTIFIKKVTTASTSHANTILLLTLIAVQAYLIYILVKIILTIFKKEKTMLEIAFPLKNGKYLITDGGNSKISRMMNYHYYSSLHRKKKTNNSMIFATDIVKVSESKKRFLPKRNEEYPIFAENVYSPMNGTVVKIENDIDDNEPFAGKYPYNTGNTVVIKSGNFYFLLGHLKKGSIKVSIGDAVEFDEMIGRIGNSGYSERPHLHVQLMESESENYWLGQGICIQYKGRNLYKNRVIKIS